MLRSMGMAPGEEDGVRDTSGIGGSPNAASATSERLADETHALARGSSGPETAVRPWRTTLAIRTLI
jgi:hypothetical protein